MTVSVPYREWLASRLKALRRKHKRRMAEVARQLDVSPRTVGHWEQGDFQPSPAQLVSLACFYRLPLADVVLPSPAYPQEASA